MKTLKQSDLVLYLFKLWSEKTRKIILLKKMDMLNENKFKSDIELQYRLYGFMTLCFLSLVVSLFFAYIRFISFVIFIIEYLFIASLINKKIKQNKTKKFDRSICFHHLCLCVCV